MKARLVSMPLLRKPGLICSPKPTNRSRLTALSIRCRTHRLFTEPTHLINVVATPLWGVITAVCARAWNGAQRRGYSDWHIL
jgi:hypothetical protein